MTIYIVEYTLWEEHRNLGVFSTHEKALEYFLKLPQEDKNYSDIVEYDLDEESS